MSKKNQELDELADEVPSMPLSQRGKRWPETISTFGDVSCWDVSESVAYFCFVVFGKFCVCGVVVVVCFFYVMEEILHQLIGSLSHYLQCCLTFQVVSRISSINSTISFCHLLWSSFKWGSDSDPEAKNELSSNEERGLGTCSAPKSQAISTSCCLRIMKSRPVLKNLGTSSPAQEIKRFDMIRAVSCILPLQGSDVDTKLREAAAVSSWQVTWNWWVLKGGTVMKPFSWLLEVLLISCLCLLFKLKKTSLSILYCHCHSHHRWWIVRENTDCCKIGAPKILPSFSCFSPTTK